MKPKLLIIVLFICFLGQMAKAEEMYEVKFSKNNISYRGLLVNDGSKQYMRVRYTDATKNVRLVEVDYTALRGMSNGKESLILKGDNPQFISKQETETYKPVHFLFIDDAKIPYVLFELGDTKNKIIATSYREIVKGNVSEAFLKQYFYSKEAKFANLKEAFNVGAAPNPNRFTTLHLVVVANTTIKDIGEGCLVDKRNVVREFQNISKALGITLKTYLIEGEGFNKTKTVETLDNLTPKINDIVIFVYRGHGFRWSDQSETWPQMDLRTSNYGGISKNTSLGLMEVFNKLKAKGARLNISLADCCNNDIGINRKTETPINELDERGLYDTEKLKKLFLESKGNVIACAASPGEYSWVNTKKGGFFTLSFIESLRQELGSKNSAASWDNVFKATINGATSKSKGCTECTKQTGMVYSNVK